MTSEVTQLLESKQRPRETASLSPFHGLGSQAASWPWALGPLTFLAVMLVVVEDEATATLALVAAEGVDAVLLAAAVVLGALVLVCRGASKGGPVCARAKGSGTPREVGGLAAGGSPEVQLRQTGSHSPVRRAWEPATERAGLLGPWPFSLRDCSSDRHRASHAGVGRGEREKKSRVGRDGGLCETEKRFKSQDSCLLMSNYTTSGICALRHTLPFGGASVFPFLNGFLP